MQQKIIEAVNSLGISGLQVTDMSEGKGSFVNSTYELPSGLNVKLWDDNKTYYINQIERKNNDRCYGVVADEKWLLVCEYGCGGSDSEIIVFMQWNKK